MVWAVVLSAVPLSSSSTEPRPPDSATIFVIAGRLQGGPGIGQTVDMTFGLGMPSWSSRAGLPNPHYAIGGASVGGRIVVVGGYNESALTYHNETYVFDPVADVWSRAADAPSKMAFPAVVGFGGLLYAFGGLDGLNKLNTTYIFDIATGGWTRGADMPLSIDRTTAVVFGGKIWVLGGATIGSDVSNVSIYDPAANSWAAGPAMPQVRNSLSAASLGGKIYVVGGHQQPGTYLNTVSVYDPTSGWSSGPAMPTARSELVTLAAAGALYAIAGQAGPGSVTANVEKFDPGSNSWSSAPSLPTGVTGPAAVVLVPSATRVPARIVAVGGTFNENGTSTSQNVEFRPGVATQGWSSHAPLPAPRGGMAVASAGGKIVVVGGYSAPNIFGRTDIFDPKTDTWRSGADYPLNVTTPIAATFAGKVYVFGGVSGSLWPSVTITSASYVYDLEADSWRALSPMGGARYAAAATEFNGKIWVIGGSADLSCGSVLTTVDIYDPAKDTWSAGPALPSARADHGVAVVGGRLYVVGGQDVPCNPTILSTLLVYDPASGWSSKASMPTPRTHLAAVAAEGYIYAIGGFPNATGSAASVDRYDPGSDSWSPVPSMPAGVGDLGVAVILEGGSSVSDRAYGVWRAGSPLPVGRAAPAMVSVGDEVYLIAGYQDSGYSSTTWKYNVRSNSWTSLPSLSVAMGASAAAFWNGKIYLFGGWNGAYQSTLFIYDTRSDSWSNGPSMPSPRAGFSALAMEDRIYLVGGAPSSQGSFTVFDPINNTYSAAAPMAQSRQSHQAAIIGGEAYLVGGIDTSIQMICVVQRFSPSTRAFVNITTLPSCVYLPFVASAGSKLYVIGGRDTPQAGWSDTTLVQVYDTGNGVWSFGPRLPGPRSYGQAATVGSTVVIAGGDDAGTSRVDVDLLSTDPLNLATGSSARVDVPLSTLATGLNQPSGIAVDSQGNVYFSEDAGQTVKRILANTTTVQTVLSSQPYGLVGLAFDANDNLFMTSYWDGRILKLDKGSSSTYTVANLTASGPRGIDIDRAGNLYVAHFNHQSILKIDPTGASTTIANVPANDIESVAVDSAGNAYFDSQGNVWMVPAGQTTARLFVIGPNAARVYVDDKDNLFYEGEDTWRPSTDRIALKMVPRGSDVAEVVAWYPANDWPQRFAVRDGVVHNTFYNAGSVARMTLASQPTHVANLLILDDNPGDNSGDLGVSVRARDPASAAPFARAVVNGSSVLLENERLKITGGPGSWFGGDIWRLTALTDKVAGVTHSDAYGNQVIAVAAQNTADTSFTYTAGQNTTHAWIFFDRLTGGYEYNLTVSVRPADPYLTLNGTVTNHNPTAMTVRTSVGEFHTAIAGDLGDDKWFIAGAGPGTFTGNSLSTAHPSVNAGYFAMWDTNDEVGVGILMSAVPDTIYTYDYYNQCACIEGIDNIATPVAFAAGEVKAFDTARILLFQGAGPEKTRELYYSLYPAAPGRFTNGWADSNSVGIENDVISLRGSPWANPNYWRWDYFNNKDAGVNQSGGADRIVLHPYGNSGDIVPLRFEVLNLPDRSVLFVNSTAPDGSVQNVTFTVLPGKPYLTIAYLARWSNGTPFTYANEYHGQVGSDLFDDQYYVPGKGTFSFTGGSGDIFRDNPTDGYLAMWDPGEHVGIGLLTPDRVTRVKSYDWSGMNEGIGFWIQEATGDAAALNLSTDMVLMAYTGSGPGPVRDLYRELYYANARLDARRHVANLSSIGSAFTYAANSTFCLAVTGSWANGAAPGTARVLEYNRDLPGFARTLYAGVEYSFTTGASTSRSYFALLDQDPSNNTGALYVTLSTPGSTPWRVTVDAAANAVNLTKYALPFGLAANGLWDIRVTGNWSDGGTNLPTVWMTTSSTAGDLANTLFPPASWSPPRVDVFVNSPYRRGDLVTVASRYNGAGANLTFLVRDPAGADLLIATAPVVGGTATITFRLADDAAPGIYTVLVTALDASATGSFRVKIPGQVVLGVITVITVVARGSSASVNVTISNGALDPFTYLIAVQVYNGTRVPWRPILQTATVPAETEATIDVSVVIPATTPLGTYTMEVILLTDHPASGGYSLDSRLLRFDVV